GEQDLPGIPLALGLIHCISMVSKVLWMTLRYYEDGANAARPFPLPSPGWNNRAARDGVRAISKVRRQGNRQHPVLSGGTADRANGVVRHTADHARATAAYCRCA